PQSFQRLRARAHALVILNRPVVQFLGQMNVVQIAGDLLIRQFQIDGGTDERTELIDVRLISDASPPRASVRVSRRSRTRMLPLKVNTWKTPMRAAALRLRHGLPSLTVA